MNIWDEVNISLGRLDAGKDGLKTASDAITSDKIARRMLCEIAETMARIASPEYLALAMQKAFPAPSFCAETPCEEAAPPPSASRFLDKVRGMTAEPIYFHGDYAGCVYRQPGMAETPTYCTIRNENLIAALVADGVITIGIK